MIARKEPTRAADRGAGPVAGQGQAVHAAAAARTTPYRKAREKVG
jgi:hypothetical protein